MDEGCTEKPLIWWVGYRLVPSLSRRAFRFGEDVGDAEVVLGGGVDDPDGRVLDRLSG